MAALLAHRRFGLKLLLLWRKLRRRANLFPCPRCCTGSGNGRNSFCPECRKSLPLIPLDVPHCPGCGGVMDGALAFCSLCLKEPLRPWKSAVAVMEYRGEAKTLIRDFKFHGRTELARPLGELAARAVRHSGMTVDLLVPVPLSPSRFLARSYNQAELFARQTGQLLNLPLSPALKRRAGTGHQSRKNRADRHKGLKGVFRISRPGEIRGKKVLLVDDVLTTGATLSAASAVLLAAGAAEVHVLCAARTLDHKSLRNALRSGN